MQLPLLPVHGEAEHKLFERLVLKSKSSAALDCEWMALEWCKHVDHDGIETFPKLPVYLRVHHKTWQRNKRVADAATTMEHDLEKLYTIFAQTTGAIAGVSSGSADVAAVGPSAATVTRSSVDMAVEPSVDVADGPSADVIAGPSVVAAAEPSVVAAAEPV